MAARWGLAACGASALGISYWEVRRRQLLAQYEAMRVRYVETGSETRFPFYGRDFGYEVDYMIELGLQQGDRCSALYRLEALPVTHALAVVWKRFRSPASADEEAVVELKDG
ncbi:unnamed protein product, partial [Effrenium voratum]